MANDKVAGSIKSAGAGEWAGPGKKPVWWGLNIHERIVAIRKELEPASKDLQVGEGAYSYRGIGHQQITDLVRPLLDRYNISIWWLVDPPQPGAPTSQVVETTVETRGDRTTKKLTVYSSVKMTLCCVSAEAPEAVPWTSPGFGDGKDNSDKAIAKAQSFGKKQALLNGFLMAVDNTPDNEMTTHDSDEESF